jgi:hypothetical protein
MSTHSKFHEALERGSRIKKELATCDSATRSSLLAAWRETIIKEFSIAIKTDETRSLQCLDNSIAMVVVFLEGKQTLPQKQTDEIESS